jgi:hypothetical protein
MCIMIELSVRSGDGTEVWPYVRRTDGHRSLEPWKGERGQVLQPGELTVFPPVLCNYSLNPSLRQSFDVGPREFAVTSTGMS